MEFKSWHDEDGVTFHRESKVYFSQCTKNKTLSLNELLRLTSDTAVDDYEKRGLSREYLLQNNVAILVSRVSFAIHRMPCENEAILINTWEQVSEPLQLMRAYTINTMQGQPLVSGLSSWLVVDPVKRKIVPTKFFTLRPNPLKNLPLDCQQPGKISIGENTRLLQERIIRFSDLDANGHTNNARYGAFIEDALPLEYAEKEICALRINYAKEAFLGDKLSIEAEFNDAQKKICLAGKTESGISFESEVFYR